MEIHGLISGWGFGVLTRLSSIVVNVRGKELNHIAQSDADQEGWDPEPEHGDSHGEVGDDWWDFVPDVEIFFVIDMVGSHFPN